MSTFSVPHHYVDHEKDLGNRVSQTGVGPYDPMNDKIEVKQYYQWVPFMLFLQGIMFYIPHIIFKLAEGGKIKVTRQKSFMIYMASTDRQLLSLNCMYRRTDGHI